MTTTVSAPYVLLHPRLARTNGSRDERRKCERYDARIPVELRSVGHEKSETIDVSREGLLVRTKAPPPIKQPVMLALHLPDGPLLAMATVVRHTVVDGKPAIGLKLLALPRQREERWLTSIVKLAEARKSESLVERSSVAAPARGPGEYSIIRELDFEIDVVE